MLSPEIITALVSITAFIVALTIHEFCHALTAYLLGDPTAKQMGRLTLNPLAHIDPLGLLLLILVRFGWARPVPFNPPNFKYPRIYSVLVGLAGPASNILLAIVCIFFYHHMPDLKISPESTAIIYEFLKVSVWINVMLGIFNLIPIPPLDGSHLLRSLLPQNILQYYYRIERISFILLIVLISLRPVRQQLIYAVSTVVAFLERLVT